MCVFTLDRISKSSGAAGEGEAGGRARKYLEDWTSTPNPLHVFSGTSVATPLFKGPLCCLMRHFDVILKLLLSNVIMFRYFTYLDKTTVVQ